MNIFITLMTLLTFSSCTFNATDNTPREEEYRHPPQEKYDNRTTISKKIVQSCPKGNKTCAKLFKVSKTVTPPSIKESPAYKDLNKDGFHIRRAPHKNISMGNLKLSDGTAEYWFLSHHSVNDSLGGTLVKMSDGSVMFMRGMFCCEAIFWGVKSMSDLKNFLIIFDGDPI
ncbi:MAG: hypothetical protein ACRBBP_00390 [Bdellovibrionales bacterium]